MATQDGNSLDAKINDIKGVLGQVVLDPSAKTTGTASTPLYVDSNSKVAQGNIPFATTMAGVVVTGMVNTTLSTLNITGAANTDNADLYMVGQLVGGSRVTTFTKTGFIRVAITDNTGILTNGDHYIQIGTLS